MYVRVFSSSKRSTCYVCVCVCNMYERCAAYICIIVSQSVHVKTNWQYVRPEDKNFKRITSQTHEIKKKKDKKKRRQRNDRRIQRKRRKQKKGILCLLSTRPKTKVIHSQPKKTSQRKKERKKCFILLFSRWFITFRNRGPATLSYETNRISDELARCTYCVFGMFCTVFLFDFPLYHRKYKKNDTFIGGMDCGMFEFFFFFGVTTLGMRCVIFSMFFFLLFIFEFHSWFLSLRRFSVGLHGSFIWFWKRKKECILCATWEFYNKWKLNFHSNIGSRARVKIIRWISCAHEFTWNNSNNMYTVHMNCSYCNQLPVTRRCKIWRSDIDVIHCLLYQTL